MDYKNVGNYSAKASGYKRPFKRAFGYNRSKIQKRKYVPKSVKMYVKKSMSKAIEVKHLDTEISGSITTTGTVQDLSPVSLGTSEVGRIGISIRSIAVKANFVLARGDDTNGCRLVVFKWKDDDAINTPTVAKVLDTTSVSSSTQFWVCPINWQNRKSIQVLYDRMYVFDDTHDLVNDSFDVPVYGSCDFNTGTTSGTNHIYCLLLSDSTIATHPTILMSARYLYKDE